MKKHKKIQEIFDIVITNDLYAMRHDGTYTGCGSNFMCHALNSAFDKGYITKEDHDYAKLCISGFIYDLGLLIDNDWFVSLSAYLRKLSIRSNLANYTTSEKNAIDKILITIYKRWSHRNVLIKKINTQFPV